MSSVRNFEPGSDCSAGLARAISACGRVLRLPGAPTPDWCERAAGALVVLVPDGGVVVALARLGVTGHVTEVVSAGAAIGPAALAAPGALTLRADVEHMCNVPWAPDALRCLWAWLPLARVACGAATLEGGRAAVLASVASPAPGELLHVALSELMAPLAEASRRTFGDGVLRQSDWLSPREQEVLSALLLGKSIREIAAESGRSAHTVHDHVKNLHRKLHANSRGELVARALGYIEPSPGREGAVPR